MLVRAVIQALYAIFKENRHAGKVIEYTLKQNPKAGSRDRAFIAETTYEIVRYYRFYCAISGHSPETEADFWELVGIHLLVPAMAAEAPGGESAQNVAAEAAGALPDWKEFKNLNIRDIRAKARGLRAERRYRESIPDWLDELGSRELGERWDDTIAALNRPARVVLRANRLKNDRAALQRVLQEEGIDTQPVGDADALILTRRQNVFQSRAFQNGLFEVQDFSSQLVAPLLDPRPGMCVVDACAGGGGKTLHLAALMQNRGSIISLDTTAWKLDELRTRARRAGATNVETRPIESRKTIKRLYGSADRLLLDVPCSGLGVLRRNPDAKWKLTAETIDNLCIVQRDILLSYSPMLKAGGRMVYATCSILPSENDQQVRRFLADETGNDFHMLEEKRILPQDEGFDGFYMALLERV